MALMAHLQRNAPVYPLRRRNNCDAADMRELITALSGISPASRHALVSIQRRVPVFPPAISAGNLHKLQQKRIFRIKLYSIVLAEVWRLETKNL